MVLPKFRIFSKILLLANQEQYKKYSKYGKVQISFDRSNASIKTFGNKFLFFRYNMSDLIVQIVLFFDHLKYE